MPLSVYSTSVNDTDINTNDCVYFIKSLKHLCNIKEFIMKIKQQKQIKSFLIKEFGFDLGETYFSNQEKRLNEIILHTSNKTQNQMKTLIQTILPRIALYKILLESELSKDDSYKVMRTYMLDVVATKKHKSTARLEHVPGFYKIYSKIFLKIMRTTELQESTQKCGKRFYDITITKCLWHTACVENGCPELCKLFCDVDDVTYGGLKKIGFSRTKTLGYGGDCCDFHFFKK